MGIVVDNNGDSSEIESIDSRYCNLGFWKKMSNEYQYLNLLESMNDALEAERVRRRRISNAEPKENVIFPENLDVEMKQGNMDDGYSPISGVRRLDYYGNGRRVINNNNNNEEVNIGNGSWVNNENNDNDEVNSGNSRWVNNNEYNEEEYYGTYHDVQFGYKDFNQMKELEVEDKNRNEVEDKHYYYELSMYEYEYSMYESMYEIEVEEASYDNDEEETRSEDVDIFDDGYFADDEGEKEYIGYLSRRNNL